MLAYLRRLNKPFFRIFAFNRRPPRTLFRLTPACRLTTPLRGLKTPSTCHVWPSSPEKERLPERYPGKEAVARAIRHEGDMGLPPDQIRGSLERYLEIDRLLGIDSAPLSPRPPRHAQLSGKHPPAAASPGRDKPVVALQALSPEELLRRQEALKTLDAGQVKGCMKCRLSRTRTQTVFGQGNPAARLVFVGEGPGADEDAQGLAFVGRAGQLLTRMIEAMGLTRDQVFICNIVKCRPPENRTPAPDEISACWPYLEEQLRIITPEVIVALGKPATQTLLGTTEGIGRLRGHWHEFFLSGSPMIGPATPLMPTFHPAYLLRDPGKKPQAWSDLQMVMARLGLPLPERR